MIPYMGRVATAPAPAPRPRAAPGAPTCDYYVRRGNGSVWAIHCENGRAVRAAGPLSPAQQHGRKPMEHFAADSGVERVDAGGWDLSAFVALGKPWALVAAPPPIVRKKVLETDGKTGFRVGFFG